MTGSRLKVFLIEMSTILVMDHYVMFAFIKWMVAAKGKQVTKSNPNVQQCKECTGHFYTHIKIMQRCQIINCQKSQTIWIRQATIMQELLLQSFNKWMLLYSNKNIFLNEIQNHVNHQIFHEYIKNPLWEISLCAHDNDY